MSRSGDERSPASPNRLRKARFGNLQRRERLVAVSDGTSSGTHVLFIEASDLRPIRDRLQWRW
ncbi:hypothetical protein RHECNPAF_170018 [Rhizobium etli CNPAF512]|nr:hypothetical protein RHECNPAF_170018 [Rhizobium etli CNPAF512]